MATQREESRQEWTGSRIIGSIDSGSLQRIADACEKMASSYDDMRKARDRYQEWYLEQRSCSDRLARKNAALRGVITRMKRKSGGQK